MTDQKPVEFLEEGVDDRNILIEKKPQPKFSEILLKSFRMEKYQAREIILGTVIICIAILFSAIVLST